jgi:hypothetical protein
MQEVPNTQLPMNHDAYAFNPAELARLRVYRAAVAADFYNDGATRKVAADSEEAVLKGCVVVAFGREQ